MEEIRIVGLDLAKNVFRVHGATAGGTVVVRKKLTRARVLSFFAGLRECVVAMEACASSHYWAREIGRLGHDVRLIAPAYVKPFVKRNKNDAADAEAIAEAAMRPTMRFVMPKDEEQQAAGMAFKTRDLFVRQRTQTINALRGHLAEYGVIAPKGKAHLGQLFRVVGDSGNGLPASVAELAGMLLDQIRELTTRIDGLSKEVRDRARSDETASRLLSIPGVGPICASAMVALAPPAETFSSGGDFSAWLGLTPRKHSSGGKERLGRPSKMGQRDLRRLLISGAMAPVNWVRRNGAPAGTWLARMIVRKPPMLVAVALANRIARISLALMARGENYRAPEPAA